jgi:hypothetical protein
MNCEELKRPPCVCASAYSSEVQNWCSLTLQYYVDATRWAAQGIPDSAVKKWQSCCEKTPATAASAGGNEAAAAQHPHGSGASGGPQLVAVDAAAP